MLKVYGLKNCDTCRKALNWLQSKNIEYQFLDIRKDGFYESDLKRWLTVLGHEKLINRRSKSWRKIDPSIQESMSEVNASSLVMSEPTLLKRPIFDDGKKLVLCGFKNEQQNILCPL